MHYFIQRAALRAAKEGPKCLATPLGKKDD
jgi:hypothetical protein